jgi:L,D-transpeptidase YbiS
MRIHSAMRIAVSIATQTLRLWEGYRLLKEYPCSTSKFGIGFVEGSNHTPLGSFTVAEKHGGGAASGTIFRARKPVGQWQPGELTTDDLVLTRILRLDGLEARNANTFARYIYIHGTNDEHRIGQRGSHGCVRMRNDHMIDLFEAVPTGTLVTIEE